MPPEKEMRKRILTGDRPTGRLHLGHWVGSLAARVKLQSECETIVIVADLHMLTTRRAKQDIEQLPANVRGLVLDYLASGMDPEKSCIYLQSAVPEIHELHTYLQNFAKVGRLLQLPSIKEMARNAGIAGESLPFGLLGYPVLQAADILLARATLTPVGKDNLAHVEIARELARQFNSAYGPVFPEPEPLLTDTAALVGTDNRGKMSKSAGNAIFLSDDEQTVEAKVRGMFTDPKRLHANIPGNVEGNPVFVYHRLFNENRSEVLDLEERYRAGKVGDKEVKEKLARAVNLFLRPFRERLALYDSKPRLLDQILSSGTLKVRRIAAETMREVRARMGLDRVWKMINADESVNG
jgi:tryptophanyl-tRNA synthetase